MSAVFWNFVAYVQLVNHRNINDPEYRWYAGLRWTRVSDARSESEGHFSSTFFVENWVKGSSTAEHHSLRRFPLRSGAQLHHCLVRCFHVWRPSNCMAWWATCKGTVIHDQARFCGVENPDFAGWNSESTSTDSFQFSAKIDYAMYTTIGWPWLTTFYAVLHLNLFTWVQTT